MFEEVDEHGRPVRDATKGSQEAEVSELVVGVTSNV